MSKKLLYEMIEESKVILDMKISNKDKVIKQLVELLGLNKEREKLLYNAVLNREEMGSTGIGNGIAIPHTRSLVITDLMIAIGRLKKPIKFNAIDKKPVRLIFLIVAPPYGSNSDYLILLGKISETFQKISSDEKLFTVSAEDDFKCELCKLFECTDG